MSVVLLSIFGCCRLACCQTSVAGATEKKPDLAYTVQFLSDLGVSTIVPEKWNSLPITLTNGRSEPRDLICSTYFGQDTSLQYGRRVWVPPQSLLRIDHPVLIPKCDQEKGRNLELHSLIFDRSTSQESLVRNEGGAFRHDGALLVTHETRNTAIIGKPSLADIDPRADIIDLLMGCRVDLQMNNRLSFLGDGFLPDDTTGFDAMDQIVMIDDLFADDLAALSALRRWLHAGGRLWIMLDRVNPVVLELLLGDDFTGYVVDRIGLTSVRVDEAPSPSDLEGTIGETAEYDDPVELVRMSVADMKVTHLVNGWPAAMTARLGEGKLLITTLGARGWMKERPSGVAQSTEPQFMSRYKPSAAMATLSEDFFRLREPPLLSSSAIEPQVGEYIGYSILSWWLIVGTLMLFSISVVAIGVWLMRCDKLEHLVWIGSALAISVSLFLIQAGRSTRQGIPGMTASVQIVHAIRGTDDLVSDGLISTYQPDGSEYPIEVQHGGRLIPDKTGMEQTPRRMVTTDLGAYYWETVRQPPGVRTTPFEHSETTADRITASISFDSQGIIGKFTGKVPPGADAILATRDGRLGVSVKSEGQFVARGDDLFEKDQYLGAGLLTDEQDRRRRTLKEVLDNPKRRDYPDRPQLMFWSGPWDNGFRFAESLEKRGASLIAVPVVIERPPSGTEIMIPSPMLSYVTRRNPDGTQSSAMWNVARHEWQERSSPGLTWLSFQIPQVLTPLVGRRARIDLKVTGPIGQIEILGLKNGNVTSLKTIANPVGSSSIEITDADVLSIDDQGLLSLGVNAGRFDPAAGTPNGSDKTSSERPIPSSNPNAKANYWRIESLALQLWAETTAPTAKD